MLKDISTPYVAKFGPYGGQFVPETLMPALEELERAYQRLCVDETFKQELDTLLKNYAGRPTPVTYAKRLSEHLGGARIYLKRDRTPSSR